LLLLCGSDAQQEKRFGVVEEAHNIMAIEKNAYLQRYVSRTGRITLPLSGRGPDQLHIKSLIERLKGGAVEEIYYRNEPYSRRRSHCNLSF